jgi:polar amino acid transport system substrate-binding protein
MGITMQYKRPELLQAVNDFVKTNIENGKLDALFQKWLHQPLPESLVLASK